MSIKHSHLAYLFATLAACAAMPALAEDSSAQPIVVGATTNALLAMQAEGRNAGSLQPVSGEEASRSYRRYLETFSRPMPQFNATVRSGASGSGAIQASGATSAR